MEVTDGIESAYRGSLFYDLAKAAVLRLALEPAAHADHLGLNRVVAPR